MVQLRKGREVTTAPVRASRGHLAQSSSPDAAKSAIATPPPGYGQVMEERVAWKSTEYLSACERMPRLEELFSNIDLDALEVSAQTQRLLAPPLLAVLDTSFVFTALQSQLRNSGAPPLSLRAAQQGGIRLFIAGETLTETFDKLDEFADALGTTCQRLEAFLIEDWAPSITVVDVAGVAPEGRAALVAERDASDRPAAVLAALLSPCILLAHDRDFEPLGIPGRGEPVLAVQATLVVNDTTVRVQAVVMTPALPVAGVVGGVRWIGNRTGLPPLLVGAALAGGGYLLYTRMAPERRATARQVLADVGTMFLEEAVRAYGEQQQALSALEGLVVPLERPRTVKAVVLRELARADEPLSAQQLWERLDPMTRPALTAVRATLRAHWAAELVGRGIWMLGLPFSHLIELGEEAG